MKLDISGFLQINPRITITHSDKIYVYRIQINLHDRNSVI